MTYAVRMWHDMGSANAYPSPLHPFNAPDLTQAGAFGIGREVAMTTQAIVITDHTTRDEIVTLIAELRERAKRYSITDQRRLRLDDQCDALVEDWMRAPDGGPEVPDP